MKRLSILITASLAALPLIAAAQTVNAPGGQAATALPPDVSAPDPTASTRKSRLARKATAKSPATSRNTEPGVNADTAVTKGPNVANTGQTQPRGTTPDTPTKKAE